MSNNFNQQNQNNNSNLIENPKAFSIEAIENTIKFPIISMEKLTPWEKFIHKKLRKLAIANPINLYYQMHVEKNDFGFYSFNGPNENAINSAFPNNNQIYTSSKHIKNKLNSNNNQVNEFYNPNNNNNLNENKNNEITNNTNIGPGNRLKSNSKDNSYKKNIKFNFPKEDKNDLDDDYNFNNNNNDDNINDNINDNSYNINSSIEEKITFADNIKKNIDDTDFFDKIKKSLIEKRANDEFKTLEILGVYGEDNFNYKINQGKEKKSKLANYKKNSNENLNTNVNNLNNINSNINEVNYKKEKNTFEKGDLNELNNLNLLNQNFNSNNNKKIDDILVLPTNNKNKNNLITSNNNINY